MKKHLIIVDVQNDFVSGSLGSEAFEKVRNKVLDDYSSNERIHEFLKMIFDIFKEASENNWEIEYR